MIRIKGSNSNTLKDRGKLAGAVGSAAEGLVIGMRIIAENH